MAADGLAGRKAREMTTRGEPAYPDSRPSERVESVAEMKLRGEIAAGIATAEQDLGTAEIALENAGNADSDAESYAAACRSIAGSLIALTRLALVAAKVAAAEFDR